LHLRFASAPRLALTFTEVAYDVQGAKMKTKTKILGAALGLGLLAASAAASAHVDVAIGLGVPPVAYAPAEPVYVAPRPVAVGYSEGWRRHEWRVWHERHEWREHHWHDRGRWDRH